MTASDLLSILGLFVMIGGLPLAYGGLILYRAYLAVVGGLTGLVLGFVGGIGIAISSDLGGVGGLLVVLVLMIFGAGAGAALANLAHKIAAAISGFVGGFTVGVAIGVTTGDPNAMGGVAFAFGALGAVLGMVLADWTVVVSTASTGAILIALPFALMMGGLQQATGMFVFTFLLVWTTGVVVQAGMFIRGDGVVRSDGPDHGGEGDPYDLATRETAMGGHNGSLGSDDDPYDLSRRESAAKQDSERPE
jgi:hypothetical protein